MNVVENNATFNVDVNPLASGTVRFQIYGPEEYFSHYPSEKWKIAKSKLILKELDKNEK